MNFWNEKLMKLLTTLALLFSKIHDYQCNLFYFILKSTNYIINTKIMGNTIQSQLSKQKCEIILKKQREQQYDKGTENEWKEARSKFFTHQIKQKFHEGHVTEQEKQEITQLFTQAEQHCYQFRMNQNKLAKFGKHRQKIQQLIEEFGLMNQQFSRRQKKWPVIASILQYKFTLLRVINIQYNFTTFELYAYEVSAFELFKVVHNNQELSSVVIKGVNVILFQKFIRAMRQSKTKYIEERWIKDFKPANSLKLSVDTQIQFIFEKLENVQRCLNDFKQFVRLFNSVSDILVNIVLGDQKDSLQHLFSDLKMLKRIKMKIQGDYRGNIDQSFALAIVGLSSLTEIASLYFKGITFLPNVSVNRFLAIEQIISVICENNTIAHLAFVDCQNFPIFPNITTLQTIYFCRVFFRRNLSFISDLGKSNPSLKSFTCYSVLQEWRIEDQLFNQLQRLNMSNCRNINLDILAQSPSKMKHLTIWNSTIGNINFLNVLLPKLTSLTYLYLGNINFRHPLFSIIPSIHLNQLYIYNNFIISSQALEVIDKKWPYLKQLTLYDCPNVHDNSWNNCQFKGLMKLSINSKEITSGHRIRQQLRVRGIKVY